MTSFSPTADSESEECRILRFLKSAPEIFAEIQECSAAELSGQKRLRQKFSDEIVRAALAVHDARVRAAGLLPAAERLWLTRTGLEQSTAWLVAHHKARRFSNAFLNSEPTVFDLCSGIGVDAAALANVLPVIAVDADPAMCLRSEWNSEEWKTTHPLVTQVSDVTTRNWTGQLVHADPDRRAGRDRPVKRLEQYSPDLQWMQNLIDVAIGGALKLSPASNFMQKFPGCEIELISLNGECREATVWFGCLSGTQSFRATVLPSGESIAGDPLSVSISQVAQCGEWIYDPDPAVVRSGMLEPVADQLGLSRLDSEEEYLTGETLVNSPFVSGFRVEAVLSGNPKELRQWLRRDASRHYEIKCRRIPVDARVIQRQLPCGQADPRVILFARIDGRSRIVVARRMATEHG